MGFILLWKVKDEGKSNEEEAGRWKDNMGRVKYVNFTCIQWQRQKQRLNMKIYRIAFYSIQYIL